VVALGFLVFIGASGVGTRTALAYPGDLCQIDGPSVIGEGGTYLYLGRVEDNDEEDEYTVTIDNVTGNSKITSAIKDGRYGEFDVDDYESISPTNMVNEMEAGKLDDDLVDFLKIHFATLPAWFDANVCGDSILSILVEGVDEVNTPTANGVSQLGEGVCTDSNGDYDCADAGESASVPSTILNPVAAAVEAAMNAGVMDCDDLGDVAEAAAIAAGAAAGTAVLIDVWIQDNCRGEIDDTFIDKFVIVDVTCISPGIFDITFSSDDETDDNLSKRVTCRGAPSSLSTISASPTTVEIVPALGNVSHSLITVTLLDSKGNPAGPGYEVDFTTNRCSVESSGVDTVDEWLAAATVFRNLNAAVPSTAADIESSPAATAAVDPVRQADQMVSIQLPPTPASPTLDGVAQGASVAGTVLGCNPGDAVPTATPGVATVTAIIEVLNGQDIVLSTNVTVVGPPASITVAANPTTLRCGEKATITAVIRDSIGQNVSEHTRAESVTNQGGVLGGTGAVAGLAGPVVPLSSTVTETFGGVATFFLLTSENHSGPYEVVVTSGGSGAVTGSLGGVFSTPPVSAQVTVTCTIPVVAAPVAPAPTVTAPRTGTGIQPPNTGDAGLADSSGSSLWLIAGVVAFALAGAATLKFARR
jgi:hypothetical protein